MSTTTDSGGRPGWLGAGRAVRRAHRRAVTHQAASVLLGYPDEGFFERLPMATRAVAELPRGTVRAALMEFCDHAASTPELELCRHYAEVFDVRRSRALNMTYYTDGDTRRGRALAEVERVYHEAGWEVSTRELPDHLAVILEFAARGDNEAGQDLLLRFRPGLELLAEALREHGTPYTRVVDAVAQTLPVQNTADREAVQRSAVQGPPEENALPVVGVHKGRVPPPRGSGAERDGGAR
ncbi:nitrate reductase molybdenum cofactor assembly chaperone [Nocardiopsis salina]|uniref:nitrate reductase molybdenum cofactor assembly chaperone n=1 Tax=Nocardiopsis salina TaxID=245836 RepID=UPI00034A5CD2|nr:nitrate reductase molybdenum cofactor assembly chaperone [Nocardiopsis salina]